VRADLLPSPKPLWTRALSDRAAAMKADRDKLLVLTRDRALTEIGADGRSATTKGLNAAEYAEKLRQMAPKGDPAAMKLTHQFQQDIAAVVWYGDALAVGLSDGRVVCLKTG